MSLLLLAAGLFVSIAIGILGIFALLPEPVTTASLSKAAHEHSRAFRWLRLWLAIGAGLGFSSLNYFLWLPLGGWQREVLIAGEVLELLLLGLVVRKRLRWPVFRFDKAPGESLPRGAAWTFHLLGICVALALAGFVIGCVLHPHGEWDAWSIWNLRARFLFRSEDAWRQAFSPALRLSHPDYPLLLPASVTRLWEYAGREMLWAPCILAGMFTFGSLGLLVSAVRLWREWWHARIAGLLLLSTPAFVLTGTNQYADMPLAFFILAALVLLSLHAGCSPDLRLVGLAGVMAGLATWTKNEGLLFLVALVLVHGTGLLSSHQPRSVSAREAGAFLLGLLPVLVVLLSFKMFFAPPNDLVAAQGRATWERVTNWSRYVLIARALSFQFIGVGSDGAFPGVVLLGAGLLAGVEWERFRNRGFQTVAGTLVVTLFGYLAVYVLTPHDLRWHLRTSLDRLLLHLWPGAVFAVSLLLAGPRGRPVLPGENENADI